MQSQNVLYTGLIILKVEVHKSNVQETSDQTHVRIGFLASLLNASEAESQCPSDKCNSIFSTILISARWSFEKWLSLQNFSRWISYYWHKIGQHQKKLQIIRKRKNFPSPSHCNSKPWMAPAVWVGENMVALFHAVGDVGSPTRP